MVQKYIAVIVVILLVGATSPAFAGEFVNQSLIAKVRLANLPSPVLPSAKMVSPRVTLSNMAGTVAMAPPQSGQGPAPEKKSGSGELTTKGKVFKWVGIGLIAEGGFDAAYGAAILKDPCSDFKGFSCTSNYSTVRGAWLGASAGVAIVGVIFLIKGLHSRQ